MVCLFVHLNNLHVIMHDDRGNSINDKASYFYNEQLIILILVH